MQFEFYDDVAFLWVMISFLGIVVVPWTLVKLIGAVSGVLCPDKSSESLEQEQGVSDEFRRIKLIEKPAELEKKDPGLLSTSNVIYGVLLALFVGLIVFASTIPSSTEVQFDPFKILELDPSADIDASEVKKAYRKMSLKYHPDKNPDNPEAEKQFVLVSKAYKTLTDPEALENFKKYGNPDGYQGFAVTLGLPSFLIDSKYSWLVLGVYILGFMVLLPYFVHRWWTRVKQFDSDGVMINSIGLLAEFIRDAHLNYKYLIEVLSLAQEYTFLQTMNDVKTDALKQLFQQVAEEMGKPRIPKTSSIPDYIMFTRILLYSFMMRKPIPTCLIQDLHLVLKSCHKLLKKMLHISIARGFFDTAIHVIELSQCITQAVSYHDSEFLQLPHFDEALISAIRKHKIKFRNFEKFLSLSDEQRMSILERHLSSSQSDDVNRACKVIPKVTAQHKCFVTKDSPDIIEGDICTVAIDIFRSSYESLDDSESEEGTPKKAAKEATRTEENNESSSGRRSTVDSTGVPVVKKIKYEEHEVLEAIAPRFPYPKAENYLIIAYNRTSRATIGFERVSSITRNMSHVEVKFPAPPKGTYDIEIAVLSDSYRNVGSRIEFKLKTLARGTPMRRYVVQDVDGDQKAVLEPEEEEEEEVEEAEDDGKDPFAAPEEIPRWYYLGGSSFGEFLLILFLLYVIVLLGADMLHNRGYISRNPFKSNSGDPRKASSSSPPEETAGSYYESDQPSE